MMLETMLRNMETAVQDIADIHFGLPDGHPLHVDAREALNLLVRLHNNLHDANSIFTKKIPTGGTL
jgi:hydroxylamine reductase (hybrid-cluster protein)